MWGYHSLRGEAKVPGVKGIGEELDYGNDKPHSRDEIGTGAEEGDGG